MSKTVAYLVARMGSSRFPGKVMQPVRAKPMIERMVERVARARSVDRIVLATTAGKEDDPLAGLAGRLGIGCHRGPAEDVLGRVWEAWKSFGGETVVELLGDNPLVHSDLIEAVLALYRPGRFDYVVNVTQEYPHAPPALRRFPVGIRVQAYSAKTLERCAAEAVDPLDREHSTRYILQHPERFSTGYLTAEGPWQGLHHPDWTFAVNYPANLSLIREIFELCAPADPNFGLPAVMRAAEEGKLPLERMAQTEVCVG